jgi:hypothetical protein
MILGTWLREQLRPSKYTILAMWATVFVAYGFLQLLRGLSDSADPRNAVQNFAFTYYIAFLFAGMWLGERHRNLLPRIVWYLAWINAIYGFAYLLKLGHVVTEEEIDPTVIPVLGWPAGSAIALLGLFAYGGSFRRIIIPVVLNGFVLLGFQVRAEWVGFVLAVTLLSVLRGRHWQFIQATLLFGGLLFVGVLVDFKVPGPVRNRGEISAREIVGRAVAIADERAAAQLTDNASGYSGTVSWRSEWWKELLKETHQNIDTTLFGYGYGYPIWKHNYLSKEYNPSPHNVFIYVISYTGWVGVFLFYTLQFYLAWLLWEGYRSSGQPFGICLWVLLFAWAHFDNRLETPYGAIPFWVLIGIALTSASATAITATQDVASSRSIDSVS